MSDTAPPAPVVSTTDKVTTISKLTVSVTSQVVFLVALGIAYLTKDSTAISLLVGAAIANSTTVVNFWLGSSAGSSSKDAIIAGKPSQGTSP